MLKTTKDILLILNALYRNLLTAPYLQLVGYKEHRLAFGGTPDSFMEDVGTNTSINRTERVIQEKYGPLAVEGTSQAHSLTLPSTQVGTSLSYLFINILTKHLKSIKTLLLLWLHKLKLRHTGVKKHFNHITDKLFFFNTSVISP